MPDYRNRLSRQTPAAVGAKKAFSLVEVLTASTVSTLVVLGVVALFISHARDHHDQKLIREMQQNIRFAIDTISRDVRMAGYGVSVRDSELSQWISWVDGFTENPLLTQGASTDAPDTLSIAAAFEPPLAETKSDAAEGATTLALESGEGAVFDTGSRSVIYVGRMETARVVNRSGDTLTVSAHPSEAGHGLVNAYPSGTAIERVDVVTYSCRQGTGVFADQPYLSRDDHSNESPTEWLTMAAAYIEDFQVTWDTYALMIDVSGRCSKESPVYTHPTEGDRYRRLTVSTRIVPRNATALTLRD
jgi:hypothetical protein